MNIKQPSTFRVQGLPLGFFGEAYVIVSVWKSTPTIWMAEFNILTKRPHAHLVSCDINFDIANYPSELEPIDEAYMEAEAERQAENYLILELEKRATELNRSDLAYLPILLQRSKNSTVNLWVSNLFPGKLEDMANHTKSSDLKNYLRKVMEIPMITMI